MTDIISGTVTDAGARYVAEKAAVLEPVVISHFILANVPGVDENTDASSSAGAPSSSYLVGGNIDAPTPHYNNDNAVTYSLVLDSTRGDYDFNYYGAVTDTGVLLAYSYIPLNKKRQGIGQVINRNLVVPFTNAKQLTGAVLPLESWQFDYEKEMEAIELTQVTNAVVQMSLLNSSMNTHERLLKLEGKL